MPRLSYGPTVKARVLQVLEMLLDYANDALEIGEIRDLDCHWQVDNDTPPRLLVRTTLRSLLQLSQQTHTPKPLTKVQIRDALRDYLADFLGVLHDCRVHARGSEHWHFELYLWSRDIDENLRKASDLWDQQHPKHNHLSPAQASPPALLPKPERPIGVPFQVPPLPFYFVERPEHQTAVKQILLENTANHAGTLVVSAIYGLGGIGKSVLAMKLAHDPEVLARYSDGVLWTTLGQQPDILAFLSHWIQELGDHSYQPITETAASAHLRTLLADKRMLLVVDDVWDPEHAEHFRVGSSNCCVLITTREARIPQARRYPLDVMSPEQSLALITQKLARPLDEQEQQQALLFADRVGYLPLALELTASQIEDGVTWSELLEDFQTEVVRLETLDVYSQDDIPEDAKRRKYSLTACFQLSLKQLSPEQLQQFAWLGVVPEDVTLTQEMAMTLWQVSQRAAGAILRTFSAKALLLKSGQQSGQRATYRMHDLMHDLAQTLLISPQYPEQAGDLLGLGLTRAGAHRQLIERYRKKTQNGLWHTLPDDGYIHAHLTWHLEQAEQFDQIHQLLQEETPEGRNGWYEACFALEQTANFIKDIARAWRLAQDLYEESPAEAIALQCRYALIKTSSNSLARNFPPELVAVLVEVGAWSPAQGLAHVQRLHHPWQRLETLEALLPQLPDSLLEVALQVCNGIQDEGCRAMALISLAIRLPSLHCIGKELADKISDPYVKGLAWIRLAIQDSRLFGKAISILKDIPRTKQRALALKEISQVVPENLLSNLLQATREFESPRLSCPYAISIGALASRMPDLKHEIHEIALPRAISISDPYLRVLALSSIAPHLPELWTEIISSISRIKQENLQADVLEDLISEIPEKWINDVITIVNDFDFDTNKGRLFGILSKRRKELWHEAVKMTRPLKDRRNQILFFEKFPSYIDFHSKFDSDLFQVFSNICDKSLALLVLAKKDLRYWHQGLDCARRIDDHYQRAIILKYFITDDPTLWIEVLETIKKIQGPLYRAHAIAKISAEKKTLENSQFCLEFLRTIDRIWYTSSKAEYLYTFADRIPKSCIYKAVEIAQTLVGIERSLALSGFLLASPEIANEARNAYEYYDFKNSPEHYKALILGGIALESPEIWTDVFIDILSIRSDWSKAQAVKLIASKVPQNFLNIALDISLSIESEYCKARALFALIPHLSLDKSDLNQFHEILSSLSYLKRSSLLLLLPLLMEMINNLGSEDALVQTIYAVRDVCSQW
jgi:hypothetical protein